MVVVVVCGLWFLRKIRPTQLWVELGCGKKQTGAKNLIAVFENFGKKKNATQPNRVAKLKEKFEIHPTLHSPPQAQKTFTDLSKIYEKTHPTLLPPPKTGTKTRPTKIPAKTSTYKRKVQLKANPKTRKISEFFEKAKPEDIT